MVEFRYNLWSIEHKAWWRPDAQGYTVVRENAGNYTEEEAFDWIKQSAMSGNVQNGEVMVVSVPRGPTPEASWSATQDDRTPPTMY